jgi:predicted O-methyltransferase YrrM
VTATQGKVGRVVRSRVALTTALREAPAVDLGFLGVALSEDGWAGAPDLLRLLYALVGALRPRHVLEFGSGISTAVIASAAGELNDCSVTSIDHDPRFAAATGELLGDLSGTVSLQCVPLVARVRAGRLGPSYLVDNSLLASPRPADLILVDGPPQVLGGRDTMLPQALEHAQCGSIILFDDAVREGERSALTAWEAQLGNAVEVHRPTGFTRGLDALILIAPTTAQIRLAPKVG